MSVKHMLTLSILITITVPSALSFPTFSIVTRNKLASKHELPLVLPASTASSSQLLKSDDVICDTNDSESETDGVFDSPDVHKKKSTADDIFVFGLENSVLQRPKGKQALLVIEDDSLETKPHQVLLVLATLAVHTIVFAESISNIYLDCNSDPLVAAATVASLMYSSWFLADLGSGVFHWSVDNYGNGNTPLLGSIIAAFQGHHTAPWTITHRSFCNNTYKLCIPFGIPTILAIYTLTGSMTTLFFACFCVLEICSQELHKWSHMTKNEVPQWVNVLQELGVTVNRKQHALHHMAPYEGNYCIVSGVCNEVLDNIGFFRRLERLVFDLFGVESNAWKLDPELRARTLQGDYTAK
jgi:hypothetical protein